MTRVPTTATYKLYLSQMTKQKSALSDMSYQAATGNKYESYDKYGLSTYRLLSLQNERAVTTKYLETNSITQVVLESQQTSVDGIRSSLVDVRSQVRNFFANDLTAMSKDPSEEELITLRNMQESAFETMSLIAYYLNSEVDGNYIFGGGKTTVPPVDFPYKSLEEFQAAYDGEIMTYPTSYSAALSQMASTAETLGGITIEQEFQTVEPKTTVFTGSAANTMTFEYVPNTLTANAGSFSRFSAGDTVTVAGTDSNNQTLTVASVSADGSNITFLQALTDEELTDSTGVTLSKTVTCNGNSANPMIFSGHRITATDPATFAGLAAGDQVVLTTGSGSANDGVTLTVSSVAGTTITFNETLANENIANTSAVTLSTTVTCNGSDTNAMNFANESGRLTANAGTFSGLEPGSRVIVDGTTGNNGALTVKSVSEDGSIVTFDDDTVVNETLTDSSGVSLTAAQWNFKSEYDPVTGITTNSLTARVGSFSDLKEGQEIQINGTTHNDGYWTIAGISKDGSTIYFEETVTDEPLDTPALTSGTVSILQSTQTGKITAASNIGEAIETFGTNSPLDVDTVAHTITGSLGTFDGLAGGQTITLTDSAVPPNEYTLYVKSVSADGSELTYSASDTGSPNVPPAGTISDVPYFITTHNDIGGFITSSLKGSALQTGDVSFNLNQNTMTAAIKGAFSQYNSGDCLIIKGADDNDKIYIVDSVSEDGRTVKFSDETRIVTEMNQRSGTYLPDGEGLTICKTYSVGATVEMKGTDNVHNGRYTVLGVSDNGREMTVRTEGFPEYGQTAHFISGSFVTDTYYKGGQLSTGYRISATSNISNDVNAAAGAFEKIFRALGSIAQGNMLDAENPESAEKRVSEAMNLLDEVMTVQTGKRNQDITSIQYSVITKLDQVQTTIENQTTMQNSLETYISALTQVDKTEAVTMLLQASENLKTSYSVLSAMNGLSLLNYL